MLRFERKQNSVKQLSFNKKIKTNVYIHMCMHEYIKAFRNGKMSIACCWENYRAVIYEHQ